jgi:hypothetical protein
MATVDDLMLMADTQLYVPRSGSYDKLNGDHSWAYWCLAYVESSHRNVGLEVPAKNNAYQAGLSFNLNSGPAPFGAAVFFGQEFYYPDGHTGLSVGEGWMIGTVTDGNGVNYCYWNNHTPGYMGWTYYPGVVIGEEIPSEPPPPNQLVQPNNPHQVAGEAEIMIAGGFLRYYNAVALGQEPMVVLGYAKAREVDARITDSNGQSYTRTIQRFERSTLIYQPEHPFPWDIVSALDDQVIEDNG